MYPKIKKKKKIKKGPQKKEFHYKVHIDNKYWWRQQQRQEKITDNVKIDKSF